MNIASIDIGTNTILLFICKADLKKCNLKPLLNRSTIPRIGLGVKNNGTICEEKIILLLEILSDYQSSILEHKCEKIMLTGTYPFRTARNASEVIDLVYKKLGLAIQVLSPEEEAKFSYLGTVNEYDDAGLKAVIDIGGGSTEITTGFGKQIYFSISVPLGAVNLTEAFIRNYPLSTNSMSALELKVRTDLLANIPNDHPIAKCIAIAGTPTSLSAIKLGLTKFDECKIHGTVLSLHELEEMTGILKNHAPDQILTKYGQLLKGREDVLFAGSYILCRILSHLHLNQLTVSAYGLRQGVILDYLFKYSGKDFVLLS